MLSKDHLDVFCLALRNEFLSIQRSLRIDNLTSLYAFKRVQQIRYFFGCQSFIGEGYVLQSVRGRQRLEAVKSNAAAVRDIQISYMHRFGHRLACRIRDRSSFQAELRQGIET